MEIVKNWSYFMSNFSLRGAQTLCGQLLVAAPMAKRVRLFAHRAAKTRRNSVVTAAAHLDEDWICSSRAATSSPCNAVLTVTPSWTVLKTWSIGSISDSIRFGIARATTKIGMANLVYNIKRLIFLRKIAIA